MKSVLKRVRNWYSHATSDSIERAVEKSCAKFDDKVLSSYSRHLVVVLKQSTAHDTRLDRASKLIDDQKARNAEEIGRRLSAGARFRNALVRMITKLNTRLLASLHEDREAQRKYYEEDACLDLLKRDIEAERGAADAAVS